MSKLIIDGHEVTGAVDNAASISCLDKDGNRTTVQKLLDKHDVGVDHLESEATDMWLTANQGRVLNNKLKAADGTSFQFAYDSATGKYGYIVTDSEGADTFSPFSNLVRDTQATADASKIARGYTAWINGVKVTGTAILVNASTGYIILNSSDTNAGKELTGGWTPSGEYGISYGNKLSTVSTINSIDLTNISKIVFKYEFSALASYNNAEYITGTPYFGYYLTSASGSKVNSTTIYAKDKLAGTFEATLNTSSLSGRYSITYILNSYWKEQDVGDYEKTYGAATRIKTIILY